MQSLLLLGKHSTLGLYLQLFFFFLKIKTLVVQAGLKLTMSYRVILNFSFLCLCPLSAEITHAQFTPY